MVELTDTQVRNLAELLGRLTRLARIASREDAVCCGVTVSQCHILLCLRQAGKTTMQSLSHELGIAPSTLTRNIDPLVANGWVLRERDDKDRRQVVVRLSFEGQEKAGQLGSVQLESCSRLLGILPATERETVLAGVDTFVAALEREMHGQCCPDLGAE